MKNWMTYLNAARPAANRHWGAGPDSDHQRLAAEVAIMSQDELSSSTARHSKRAMISATEQGYAAPYDHRMGDRFRPVLSTR